jgi:hypothetical protein
VHSDLETRKRHAEVYPASDRPRHDSHDTRLAALSTNKVNIVSFNVLSIVQRIDVRLERSELLGADEMSNPRPAHSSPLHVITPFSQSSIAFSDMPLLEVLLQSSVLLV